MGCPSEFNTPSTCHLDRHHQDPPSGCANLLQYALPPNPTTLHLRLVVASEPIQLREISGVSFSIGLPSPRTFTLQELLGPRAANLTHFTPASCICQCPDPPTVSGYTWGPPTAHHSECSNYSCLLGVSFLTEMAMNVTPQILQGPGKSAAGMMGP